MPMKIFNLDIAFMETRQKKESQKAEYLKVLAFGANATDRADIDLN